MATVKRRYPDTSTIHVDRLGQFLPSVSRGVIGPSYRICEGDDAIFTIRCDLPAEQERMVRIKSTSKEFPTFDVTGQSVSVGKQLANVYEYAVIGTCLAVLKNWEPDNSLPVCSVLDSGYVFNTPSELQVSDEEAYSPPTMVWNKRLYKARKAAQESFKSFHADS